MIQVDRRDLALEPQSFVLVFSRVALHPWQRWLGRYKHVRAYAYLPATEHWLFYDVHYRRTQILVVPDGDAVIAILAVWQRDADIIRVPRRDDAHLFFRIGFWCVPAMKHLIGLRSSALRPDALWRDCVRAGGQQLGSAAVPTAADESRAPGPATAG
jgi:hypothetical protein